jgi:hypothetical protein
MLWCWHLVWILVRTDHPSLGVGRHIILALQEENLRVTRIVVNNNKNIPLASHAAILRRTDGVHME